MTWYSVRCVFEKRAENCYSERFTLWWTSSFDRSLALAEEGARIFERASGWTYVGLAQAYLSGDEEPIDAAPTPVEPGDELFSLLRESDLGSEQYVRAFFETGREVPSTRDGAGWFTVRCIFEWPQGGLFEEQITLWSAKSAADAVRLAESAAEEYAEDIIGGTYLGVAQPYSMGPQWPAIGAAVFVLDRCSELRTDPYVKAMFDTGREYESTIE